MKKEKSISLGSWVWHFPDGTTAEMSAAELEEILQSQHHRAALSDDPLFAETGRRLLRKSAENAAAQQIANMHRAAIAKRPRSSKRGDLKEKIQAAMRVEKTRGTDFKTFMKYWSQEPLNGLRCTPEGEAYLIDDEDEIELCQQKYTWGTLRTYYAQS